MAKRADRPTLTGVVNTVVTAEEQLAVRVIAATEGRTTSALLRDLVRAELARRGIMPEPAQEAPKP